MSDLCTFVVLATNNDVGDDGEAGHGIIGKYFGSVIAVNYTAAADKIVDVLDAQRAQDSEIIVRSKFYRLSTPPCLEVRYFESKEDVPLSPCSTSKYFLILQDLIE